MSLGRKLKALPGVASVVWHIDHLFELLRDLQRHQRDAASDSVLQFEALERALIRLAAIAGQQDELQSKTGELITQMEVIREMLTRMEGQFAAHLRGLDEKLGPRQSGALLTALGLDQSEPEIALLQFMSAELRRLVAIDVGASDGRFSQKLLEAGLEVYALEPAPRSSEALTQSLGGNPSFHPLPVAAGSRDAEAELTLSEDTRSGQRFSEGLAVLANVSPGSALKFSVTTQVSVRRISTLIEEGRLPAETGILRISAQGTELDVLEGLGPLQAEIVQVRYAAEGTVAGRAQARNNLPELTAELRRRGFGRHLVIARPQEGAIVHYANLPVPMPGSWGNAIFFREEAAFQAARRWCDAVLAPAYLYR